MQYPKNTDEELIAICQLIPSPSSPARLATPGIALGLTASLCQSRLAAGKMAFSLHHVLLWRETTGYPFYHVLAQIYSSVNLTTRFLSQIYSGVNCKWLMKALLKANHSVVVGLMNPEFIMMLFVSAQREENLCKQYQLCKI